MKKIVALALCLIMALSLCATAMAADTVTGKAYRDTSAAASVATDTTLTFHAAVAATTNDDGKQTNKANIAYYTCDKMGGDFVVVNALKDADLVVYSDNTAKNVVLYLAKAVVSYDGTGTTFTNFGKSCGQVDYKNDAAKTYYTTNGVNNKNIYVADEEGTMALMVGGKLVTVNATPVATTATAKTHAAVPTVVDGKVTGYTCATCKAVAIKAGNVASIPEDAEVIAGTLYYFAANTSSTTAAVSSAKTFDAGIALYVGMSISAVAGSAVVIGKKKEF